MTRDILFRAKCADNGEWAEGVPIKHSDGDLQIHGGYSDAGYFITIDPETVCQYTGLTDRGGRKIFEGDIIAFTDMYSTDNGYAEGNCVGEVLWSEEEACFHVTERLSYESWEVLQDCEIIGNIFDNPELIGGNP